MQSLIFLLNVHSSLLNAQAVDFLDLPPQQVGVGDVPVLWAQPPTLTTGGLPSLPAILAAMASGVGPTCS